MQETKTVYTAPKYQQEKFDDPRLQNELCSSKTSPRSTFSTAQHNQYSIVAHSV